MKRILLAAALLLTCPASASAALEDGLTTDMLGARQACTSAGQCFVLETRDQVNASWGMRRGYPDQAPDYQSTLLRLGADYFYGSSRCSSVSDPMRYGFSVPGSCVAVPGTNSIWIVYKRHEFNANAYATLTFVLYHSADGVHDWIAAPSATYDAAKNAADCNPTGTMSHYMELYPGLPGTGYVASAAAPQGFIDACRLLTREQAAQVVATNPTVNPPTIPTTNPTTAATCAPLTYRRKRVVVASYSVRCTTARTIMARYLTRGIEPRGWVCVQARAGRMRTSACGRPARSRARAVRVTARWRA
jgi:hypothetical protein